MSAAPVETRRWLGYPDFGVHRAEVRFTQELQATTHNSRTWDALTAAMTSLVKLALIAAATGLLLAGMDGRAASANACSSAAGATAVAHGAEVVVSRGVSQIPTTGADAVIYGACDKRNGRRTVLERLTDADTYVREIRVHGRYVAYAVGTDQECSQCNPGTATVKSLNARTGRTRNVGPTGKPGATIVDALIGDASGRIAWVSSYYRPAMDSHSSVRHRSLRKLDAAGPGLIAASSTIDGRALRLSNRVLRWIEDGQPRTRILR